MALSWDEIVERGKQHNKTVICEVEKRGYVRYFHIKCDVCGEEKDQKINHFGSCKNCHFRSKTSNTEQFITKAKKIHGDKYNYNSVEYILDSSKIKIFCNDCNKIFLQTPNIHLRGGGCSECAVNAKRLSLEQFILKAKKIHFDKYNYDLVEYINSSTKVQIHCNKCKNTFLIKPNNHLSGIGCSNCANLNKKSNKEEFVKKSKKIYGDKFDYGLVEYIDSRTKVKIFCNDCKNIFSRSPYDHLRNKGCFYCNKFTTEQFISQALETHGYKYNYDLSVYKSMKIKLKILCKSCNKIFEQTPDCHLRGHGCRCFTESKGENKVAKYLSENNIEFTKNKIFITLKDKSYLKPDFYLEDLNLLIEYDGEYHYKAIKGSTPEIKQKNLESQQRRDKIKDEWAKANNIPLLRIPYWDFDRIEELVGNFVGEYIVN